MESFILAIDQGTTSSRAIIFDNLGERRAVHQIELKQYYPENGWVEHDPEEIWQSTLTCCREVIPKAGLTPDQIATIGISNQRETTILWDKNTNVPAHRAIVWQDRRTVDYCHQLIADEKIKRLIHEKTGLLIDPYFCATKIKWLLDNIQNLRASAETGNLIFGTVDTYLIWQLTSGRVHATDATNASRTLLFNIHTQDWDDELLELFDIPREILPEVRDCNADFGSTNTTHFGIEISINGVAGDQQAALVGQACFDVGMAKSTYGTGCFIVLNTGETPVDSSHRLLTTVGYRIDGKTTYALEGSIFVAGAALKWLRDTLHLVENYTDTEDMVAPLKGNGGVYLVPAFTGLGAPYWDPRARGAIFGLTRDTGIAQIVRAALEAVCYQTKDLMHAMAEDFGEAISSLRIDGGMVNNEWLAQFLSDLLVLPVESPACVETSALGAAYLAGLGAGVFKSFDDIKQNYRVNKSYKPEMDEEERKRLFDGWHDAIQRVLVTVDKPNSSELDGD